MDGLHRVAAVQGIIETVTEDQTVTMNSPTEEKVDKEGRDKSLLALKFMFQFPSVAASRRGKPKAKSYLYPSIARGNTESFPSQGRELL